MEGERQARRELTLTEAAEQLGVSTMTLRRLIKRQILSATQAGVGAPWVIRRDDLALPSVQNALRDPPRTANDKQMVLDFQ